MKRRVPGLIKRIMAALSNKTNELRTRIMIFFLLHRNHQSLLLDKFQTVVAGRRHAHRNRKVTKEVDNVDQGSHVDVDYCPRRRGGEEESFIMYMNTEPEPGVTMETSTGTSVDPTMKQVFSYAQAQAMCDCTESKPEDSCIDLTRTLFKESEEEMKKLKDIEDDATINRMVNILEDMDNDERLNKEEEEEEAGEEDIDHAADVFIERFRRQILLQRQLSLQERHSTTTTTTSQMLQHNA